MGKTSRAKQKKIERLRNDGFTQQEVAGKLGLDVRTVRKYDPLREKKSSKLTDEQIREFLDACNELVAAGLLHTDGNGRFRISFLGKRAYARYEELGQKALLEYMAEAGRPVAEEELERYFNEIDDELFYQALSDTKRRYG